MVADGDQSNEGVMMIFYTFLLQLVYTLVEFVSVTRSHSVEKGISKHR